MALLRSALAGRALLRTLPTTSTTSTFLQHPALRSRLCTVARRPIIPAASASFPTLSGIVRHQSGGGDRKPVDQIDKAAEDKYAHQKLERHPEIVSTTSSIHPLTSEITDRGQPQDEPSISGPIMADVVCSSLASLRCILSHYARTTGELHVAQKIKKVANHA